MDCCCSVAQLCLTIFNPMDCCMPGFPVLYYPLEFAQTHVHWAYPTISSPVPLLLLLPSIFLSIRVFSEESALHIRWPKYWSFSFSISPSSEYSGLISFGIEMDMPTFSAYNPLTKLVTPVPLSSRNCPILPCPKESQISGVKKKKVILRETCSCFLILTLRRESPPTHRCESEAKEIIQPNFKFWELWILKIPHIYLFLPHCPSFSSGLLLTTQAIILFIYFLNYLFIFRMYFLYFTILYWFCHTSTWICHGCTHVPHPEQPSHIPPCTIPLCHPNAPAPSILYHASNLDRHWF